MATEEPSTQTLAAILIIVCLVVLLPCLYMRARMNKRNAPVFGHFRSVSRRQRMFLRRQSAPPRLEQVIVQVPEGADAETISNCSILPRYEVDKAPPAYTDGPSAINDDMTRLSSIDLSDVLVANRVGFPNHQ